MSDDKEVTEFNLDNIDNIFTGMPIDRNKEGKPTLLRQMVWDSHMDSEVEKVIDLLGLTPASDEVYSKELLDSHTRLLSLSPMFPIIRLAAENMTKIYSAKILESIKAELVTNNPDQDDIEIPDYVVQTIMGNTFQFSYTTILSTLSALRGLGFIEVNI